MNLSYQVVASLVDVTFFEGPQAGAYRKVLLLRPIRQCPNGRLGVLEGGRVHPLYRGERDELVFFGTVLSYELRSCQLVRPGEVFQVPRINGHKPWESGQDLSWHLVVNQFGIYVHLNTIDDIVQRLVIELSEKARFRVIAWDSTEALVDRFPEYPWYVQLSPGLSVTAVSAFLSDFRSRLLVFQRDISARADAVSAASKHALSDQMKVVLHERDAGEAELRAELQCAYAEISRLLQDVEHLETERRSSVAGEYKERADRYRKTPAEKVLAHFLLAVYPKLAFPPDTPKLILERFSNSKVLWPLLAQLNDGVEVSRKSIQGIAGKVGWQELDRHIASGSDARGRLYLRSAKGAHRLDLVLHWKKDASEQERTFRGLANYTSFDNPSVVLG